MIDRPRTIGLELEIADVDRKRVRLPYGWSWSANERCSGTDGRTHPPSYRYGGELNTAPMPFARSSMETMADVLKQVEEAGGKAIWTHGYAVHIDAGGVLPPQLANLFLLSYHCSGEIREIAHCGEWDLTEKRAPVPTEKYAERVRGAQTLKDIETAFSSSLQKRFIRHIINVSSVLTHGTVEFRIFNPTMKVEEVVQNVIFALRLFRYGISHTEEDFVQIHGVEGLREAIGFRGECAPQAPILIFAGEERGMSPYKSRPVAITNKLGRVIKDMVGDKTLCCAAPYSLSGELQLYNAGVKLRIRTLNPYALLMKSLARGERRITYRGDYAILNSLGDGSPETEVANLLIMRRLRLVMRDNDRDREVRRTSLDKYAENYDAVRANARAYCEMLSKVIVEEGTLNDAIATGADYVLWRRFDNKVRRVFTSLQREDVSDLGKMDAKKECADFWQIEKSLAPGQTLLVLTECPYLSLRKECMQGRTSLYSTRKETEEGKRLLVKQRQRAWLTQPPPPAEDDLIIDDWRKLSIVEVKQRAFLPFAEKFVKKVATIQRKGIGYLVLYDGRTLGGFSFWRSNDVNYDAEICCDFGCNEKIARLSKLIVLCALSEQVQRAVSIKFLDDWRSVYTKAWTHKPVSMKYRGILKKNDELSEVGHELIYEGELGSAGTLRQVYEKWDVIRIRANGKR